MKFAVLLKDNLPGWTEHAALYMFTPPLQNTCMLYQNNKCMLPKAGGSDCVPEYVIISAVSQRLIGGGSEVKAFLGDKAGNARCMMTLGVVEGSVSHETLIEKLGYKLAVKS